MTITPSQPNFSISICRMKEFTVDRKKIVGLTALQKENRWVDGANFRSGGGIHPWEWRTGATIWRDGSGTSRHF